MRILWSVKTTKYPVHFLNIFRLEYLEDLTEECFTSWSAKPNKYDSVMEAGLKTSNVRKIQVLRDQKTPFILRGSPYRFVSRTAKSFGINGFDIVAHGT